MQIFFSISLADEVAPPTLVVTYTACILDKSHHIHETSHMTALLDNQSQALLPQSTHNFESSSGMNE
jgi:hypothetical protein